MPAPRCCLPTKQDGRPCRRARYQPCGDHGGSSGSAGGDSHAEALPEVGVPDQSRYRDPNWQRGAAIELQGTFGRTNTKKLKGLKDCRDLARVAQILDEASKLEPDPLLDRIEEACGPEAAQVIRDATSGVIKRLTVIQSLKGVARMLRIAGVLHCVAADALETCPCLKALEQGVKRAFIGELSRDGELAP